MLTRPLTELMPAKMLDKTRDNIKSHQISTRWTKCIFESGPSPTIQRSRTRRNFVSSRLITSDNFNGFDFRFHHFALPNESHRIFWRSFQFWYFPTNIAAVREREKKISIFHPCNWNDLILQKRLVASINFFFFFFQSISLPFAGSMIIFWWNFL